jgi:hypothetical protein
VASDPGAFLRLKSAIDATIGGIDEKSVAAKAFADAYATFRAEAQRIAQDQGVAEEFSRMFPAPTVVARPTVQRGLDPFGLASDANDALSLLVRLSGWLDGFVQEVRLKMEAEAYATARLKHES